MSFGKAAAASAIILARAVAFGASLLLSSEATAKTTPVVDEAGPTISAPLVPWM
ncbi:hypothetical protein JOD31_001651 [Methylopila capsulata]|nr:hypothetical protein [Methylopila capsulata]MBM7851426.1 hypothetical protein [Methylopila capsulata]